MERIDYAAIVPETDELEDIDTDMVQDTIDYVRLFMVDDEAEDFQFAGELNFN